MQIASQIQNENEEKIDNEAKKESCYSNFDGEYIEVRPIQTNLCNITSKGYVEDKNNYNPHEELFNQGKLKQYDIGLEEARESKSGSAMGCCQSFFATLCGIFSKKEEKQVEEIKN